MGSFANSLHVKYADSNCVVRAITKVLARSEEHTSELQSQSNLVCRLLLEKKKQETQRLNSRKTEARPSSASPRPCRAQCEPDRPSSSVHRSDAYPSFPPQSHSSSLPCAPS